MQFGQHTSLDDESSSLPVSLATAVATLINRRARLGREAASLESPDGNVLIWLDDPTVGRGPVDPRGRGIIVVTHDANQAVGAQPFIVSYPVKAGRGSRKLGAVADLLTTMGWSLLAFNRKQTDLGNADIASLVNANRFGCEQRLWLAEPFEAHPSLSVPPFSQSPKSQAYSDAGSSPTA